MVKNKKSGRLDLTAASAADTPPAHNPFAALAGLRDSLPGAERAPEAAPTPARPAAASEAASVPSLASGIVLRRERKGRGGKTITRIDGLPERGAELDTLARELKRGLGCGASVEGDAILLQGDLVERALRDLLARGYRGARAGN